MKPVRLPGGGIAFPFGASDEEVDRQQRVIDRRWAFAKKYIDEKGWGVDRIENLSVEQLMEIRSQPEWKKAGEES